jgi:predicted secreted protein/GNAT superfamily N-acetyltransferase
VFTDKRSHRVILVAHCVLNQNAKIDQCAHYPGTVKEVAQVLIDAGAGIVQMPCPELVYLGLDRQADRAAARTVPSEDTRVAHRMGEARGQVICRELALSLVYQVEEYRKNGFEVLGIVGINGSPTCGVEVNWANDQEQPGPGVFIRELNGELERREIALAMRGIRAYEPGKAVAAVTGLIETALSVSYEDPTQPEVTLLIQHLSAELGPRYGDDGSGSFSLADVQVPRSALVVARLAERAVGCGALRPMKETDDIAEIKRMFVEPDVRGRGIARRILSKLEEDARGFGYHTLVLETGNLQVEAIHLYEQAGYTRIPCYGQYVTSSWSICFRKEL